VAAPDDLARLAGLAQQHDLWVISDEVYGQIRYDGKWDSIAALPGMAERTFIVDGFSKTYSMTGWRLGFGVMPKWLADPVTTLLINNISCTTTFVQYAGLAPHRAEGAEVRPSPHGRLDPSGPPASLRPTTVAVVICRVLPPRYTRC